MDMASQSVHGDIFQEVEEEEEGQQSRGISFDANKPGTLIRATSFTHGTHYLANEESDSNQPTNATFYNFDGLTMFEDADDEDFEAIVASQEESQSSVSASSSLSLVQKDKIERNRRKALALKLAREKIKDERTKEKDSGAGFFIPPEEDSDAKVHDSIEVEGRPAPFIGDGMPECIDCEDNFSESYLFTTFGHYVCDGCKENDHNRLITKTEAKKIFLLKDCDLDRREPPLKFIIKKNPHNPRWGENEAILEISS
ncbi:XPA [Lepeophtheirus salmonis]|uniref:XPA n=1 Tax=Lepeophtheirus salmonis TaxID=72036 RepID=A0A7R8CP75_LEPSM|nr:XPA [Lepeophtheirus salmonis]CAF2883584.1 XPA [Lepeophtheirus salmonis]